MKSILLRSVLMLLAIVGWSISAYGEVVSSSRDHYVLKHEAVSPLSPAEIWQRLANPAIWWHPDHTYSGDSGNLSVALEAGGLWREDWTGGSVLHGTVLSAVTESLLRLNAPFGPLQQLAVTTIWTIQIEAHGDGSKVVFHEVSGGAPNSALDELAPAVDFVKKEALMRLTKSR